MRAPLLASSLLVLVGLPLVAGAANWEFEYVAPGTLAVPGLRTDVALCSQPDGLCMGGARFPMTERNAIAVANDELWGGGAALVLCAWNPGGDGDCGADDASTSVGCGTRALLGVPYLPDGGVVYLYSIHVDPDLTVCGATNGRASITAF